MTHTLQDHSNREHSEFGGSAADRAIACPGSVALGRQVPKVLAGPDAERGTACHEVLAELLSAFLLFKEDGTAFDEPAILSKLAADPRVGADKLTECEDAVTSAVEEIWVKVLGQSITGKAYFIEELFPYNEGLDMYGTLDFGAVYIDDRGRRVLAVVDFKTGRIPVSPKKNGQLAFYAASVRKYLKANGKDIDLILAVIIQPNDFSSAATYKEATITAKQLDAWDKRIMDAAHQIYVKKKPKFKTGDHCMWCSAKHLCKKFQADLSKKASLQLVDVAADLPAVEVLTEAQRLGLAMNRGKIEAFLKAVYVSVLNDAVRGTKFDGVKVVLGNSRRKWKDEHEIISLGLMGLGLGLNEIYSSKLRGITEIEKKLGKGSCDPFTEKPPGRPMLVAADDVRPAVTGGQELLDFDLEE